MKSLFEKWFCKHKWKLIKEIDYVENRGETPKYKKILYCCENCGKFKNIRF